MVISFLLAQGKQQKILESVLLIVEAKKRMLVEMLLFLHQKIVTQFFSDFY